MNPFTIGLIGLMASAGIYDFWLGNYWKTLYWEAAAVLNVAILKMG